MTERAVARFPNDSEGSGAVPEWQDLAREWYDLAR